MKRVFSLLLVLLLMVGLMPMQAQADGEVLLSVIWMTKDDVYVGQTSVSTQSTATVSIPVPDGYIITDAQPEADTPGLINSSNWTVTMPGADVMILVTVERPDPQPPQQPDPQPPAAQPHSITVTPNGNGTASVTVNGSPANTATKGEIVTVTGTPAENHYVLSAVARTAADNPVTDFAKKDEGIFTFTMPDEDVEITVYFQEMTPYQVKVEQPVDGHGTVAAAPAEQLMGRPVTVTVTPEDGYRLAGITVTNNTTTEAVSLQADGKTFYMPGSDVTVTASFEAIPSHKVTVTKPDCVTLDISDGEEIREGAPVTIIPRIDGDFMPETLTITGPDGEKIELNDNHQFIMPSGPVTIEITVVPSVTITFAPNGGTVDPTAVTIQKSTALGTLPKPVRQDYLFTGWYPAAGDKITTSTVFDTNTTVTARWVKAEHTTNLRGNDFGADIAMENIDVLDLLLDEDDLSQGKDIIVYMEVDKLGELAVPKEDKSAIDAKAGSDKLAAYLDITLWKKIGDDPETRITNTNGDVPITMTLDEGIVPADAGSVYIIYYHEGKVATITNGVSYNASSRVLRFPANEFSTYALAYKVQAPAATTSAGVLDNVPKTGDETGLVGWTMLVLCSAAMLAAVAVFDKKRAR